jgi:hypothetical protein
VLAEQLNNQYFMVGNARLRRRFQRSVDDAEIAITQLSPLVTHFNDAIPYP